MIDAIVAVQARTGSSRLPGKVLADLAGRPMLGFQLARLARLDVPVVVATSDRPGDDPVAELATAAGVEVVRGPEDDVLARFAVVLDRFAPRHLVRLTGDCPFTDPDIVRAVLDAHVEAGADYTSNLFPRSYPKGLDVEVATADALAQAAAEAQGPGEREHVMPFLYRRPERFRMANVASGLDLGEEWWVVDTAADLESARAVAASVADPVAAGWRDLLAAVGVRRATPPGAVHLAPAASADPGTSPWVRTWTASRDGAPLATVRVAVGHGLVTRTIEDRGDAWSTGDDEAIWRAVDDLLIHDEQVRR